MLNRVISFVQNKYPYILGFFVIEAGIYYFNGPTGNFNTGLLSLFAIWLYYNWMSKEQPADHSRPQLISAGSLAGKADSDPSGTVAAANLGR